MPTIPQPQDFFGEQPPPRIIGTEREIVYQGLNDTDFFQRLSSMTLETFGISGARSYFGNGSRIYQDVGHVEYATPESLGPKQAAEADWAGLLIIGRLARQFPGAHMYANSGSDQIVPEESESGDRIYKLEHFTRGYHENYLIPDDLKRGPDSSLAIVLPAYLASRVWAMAGMVGHEGYVLSQKASGINGEPIAIGHGRMTSYGDKPMIFLPNPDIDLDLRSKGWERLEVRFADGGISPKVRFLGLAATSLVLRMLEHPHLVDISELEEFAFDNPVQAAKRFGSDVTLSVKEESLGGKRITAADYQIILAEAALDLSQHIQLPDDEVAAARLWMKAAEELKNGVDKPLERVSNMFEFSVRLRFLLRQLSDKGSAINAADSQSFMANALYDRIEPPGAGMQLWSKVGSDTRHFEFSEAERLMSEPPATRAMARAEIIDAYGSKLKEVSWNRALTRKIGDKVLTFLFVNPYDPNPIEMTKKI